MSVDAGMRGVGEAVEARGNDAGGIGVNDGSSLVCRDCMVVGNGAVGVFASEVELELLHDAGSGHTDDGLVLPGCPGETTLPPPGGQTAARVGGATGVALAGFIVEGGTWPIWIWTARGSCSRATRSGPTPRSTR